jgi:hypothetical protein
MKLGRAIAVGVGAMVLIPALVALLARFADGPLGPFPGGPLVAGDLADEPVTDWAFVENVTEIELQLLDPPRSRTTWILLHEGSAYVPCGFPNVRIWKQWPYEAQADGRAMIRVDGRRYRVDLVRVEDPTLEGELTRNLERKYASAGRYSGAIWFFRLDPASSD